MKPKCHYPNLTLLKSQIEQTTAALTDLADLGVEVLVVRFREPAPVIEVAYCRGCDSIQHAMKGRGRDNNGTLYVRRVAYMRGCVIEWNQGAA